MSSRLSINQMQPAPLTKLRESPQSKSNGRASQRVEMHTNTASFDGIEQYQEISPWVFDKLT